MAAAPFKTRHADEQARLRQQFVDGRSLYRRMVRQGEQNAFRIGRYGSQPALHRAGLAGTVIGIEDKDGIARDAAADFIGVGSQHHDHGRTMRRKQRNQRIEKGSPAIAQQRLGRSHAARFARGQN